jgi:hypothetical protein
MKNFFRAYTFSLTPTAILSIAGAIFYYTTQFSINKAISIGTLNGFMIALIINILPAFIILSRLDKPAKVSKRKQKIKTKDKDKQPLKTINQSNNIQNTPKKIKNSHTIHSLYLLLDKEKALDLSIDAILNQSLGTILDKEPKRGFVSARTAHQIINFNIQPLTRHTAKVEIDAQQNNTTLNKILNYIKQKESFYLNY